MPRNKHPEETVQKILSIAFRLFQEKGYDETSIEDIVAELGMSKGAVYHHFKNKEEILDRASQEFYHDDGWFDKIAEDKSRTGLERLQAVFRHELSDEQKRKVDMVVLPALKDPRIVMKNLEATLTQAAPRIEAILRDGIADGSIPCQYPKQAAEVILLLSNMWLNAQFLPAGRDEFFDRLRLFSGLLEGVGIPLLDDEAIGYATAYFDAVLQTDK